MDKTAGHEPNHELFRPLCTKPDLSVLTPWPGCRHDSFFVLSHCSSSLFSLFEKDFVSRYCTHLLSQRPSQHKASQTSPLWTCSLSVHLPNWKWQMASRANAPADEIYIPGAWLANLPLSNLSNVCACKCVTVKCYLFWQFLWLLPCTFDGFI